MVTFFSLLVLFQLKHFLADYPLQRPWMLGKFKDGWEFALPLLAHVTVHGFMTFAIVLCYRPHLAALMMVLDMTVHFVMDRIKASKKYLGRWRPLLAAEWTESMKMVRITRLPEEQKFHKDLLRGNRLFWHSIGFDQMVHHLTHYLIIYIILR